MTATMTPRGRALLEAVRRNFDQLVDHEKYAPSDVATIVDAMVAHLRAWKPMALLVVPEGSSPR